MRVYLPNPAPNPSPPSRPHRFYSRPTLYAVACPGVTPAARNWISISRHGGGGGGGRGVTTLRTRKEEDTWSYCFVMATRPPPSPAAAAPAAASAAREAASRRVKGVSPVILRSLNLHITSHSSDRMSPQSRVSLRFAPAEARRSSRTVL
jgi:hypothetical protein